MSEPTTPLIVPRVSGADLVELLQTVESLTAALKLIASYNGQTLFSSDPGYREGAAHAFATLAEIARQAVGDTP